MSTDLSEPANGCTVRVPDTGHPVRQVDCHPDGGGRPKPPGRITTPVGQRRLDPAAGDIGQQ